MALTRPAEFLATKKLIVRSGFLLIVAALLLGNLVSLGEIRSVQSRNRLLFENALTSIELVSRISHDIDQKRLLVDEHIFEKGFSQMAQIEASIAGLDSDFARASRSYEPLATFTGEHQAWESLTGGVSALQAPIRRALDLSRNNQDAEAQAVMQSIRNRYNDIGRATAALIRINHDEVEGIRAAIRAEQRQAMWLLAAITLTGTILALGVGAWVTRVLKQRDEQVRRASSSLEERNRELDAFAGRVAHDLRGPLTTVSVSAASLAERVPKDDGAVAVLRRSVARMDNLIQDLLTLSRIEGQPSTMVSQAAFVVSAVEQELRPGVEHAGGLLHVRVAPAQLRCSDGLLRQVLWNLGENAVKYRRPDVQLEIGIQGSERGRSYELRISDNGSGMSPSEARQAFEPFFRGGTAQSTTGTGLGLSIVKRIIEFSGGTVYVDSEADKGTTFVINLPLA